MHINNPPVCPIWGTPVTEVIPVIVNRGEIPKEMFDSPRAGGKYIAHVNLQRDLELLECGERVKARLTTWLIDQRQFGEEFPVIDAEIIEKIKQQKNLSVHERADRLLRAMEKRVSYIGELVKLQSHTDFWLAYSESINEKEARYLTEYLQNQGWLSITSVYSVPTTSALTTVYQITVEGYVHLAELDAVDNESEQAFVAMWFDKTMNAVWKEGIQPAIEEAGYKPVRIDWTEFIDKVDDQIIAEIRRSRFLVADFTHGETGVRGGVYYEAGFAHGLNIPVIFSCRKDCLDKIHFDARQYNCIDWEKPKDLQHSLVKRICAVIGDGPRKT